VQIQDQFGNPLMTAYGNSDNATSVTLSAKLSPTGNPVNGVLGGTLIRTASNGIVTFNDLSYSLAENIFLYATSGIFAPKDSTAVTMTPSALTTVTLAPQTASTE
jgi:hypothetical protein